MLDTDGAEQVALVRGHRKKTNPWPPGRVRLCASVTETAVIVV